MNESNRQRKAAQIIREDFAELFRKQAAESTRRFLISVSDVKLTADLSIAKIYLSIFPQEFREPIMKEIEENKSKYRNFIGQKIGKQVRIVPELQFYIDTSLDDAEKLEKELKGEGDNPIL
ncbi:MAG: 30S ribosome-binding factor RbfA [Flavobacteriaceae bacterium]|jgi:ribosome-binding factor A|nr:30S ribosome-binding factor RbfA [Flavobacteriaceae bacterium]